MHLVDLSAYRPHVVALEVCPCGHWQLAVAPETCPQSGVECAACRQMTAYMVVLHGKDGTVEVTDYYANRIMRGEEAGVAE